MLPVIDSKYKVLRPLGQGGGGMVFVAWHEQLQREVAIKVLNEANPEATEVQRFKQEAQALTACNHAGIVHILAFGKTDDNRLYYVMDYIDGKSLAAEIRENGPLSPARFEQIFDQVLAALEHAHQAGLIHRDIKPSNIMLTSHGGTTDEQAILIDFGLTRSLEHNVKLTATDSLIGTPFYMSPEQCTGSKVDQRSDIYSLGCTMLEAATGKPPFSGEAFEVLFAQVNQAPDAVPKELMPLMDGCLAKEPGKRFPNARAARAALDSLGLTRYKQFSTGKFAINSGHQSASKKSTTNHRMQLAVAAAIATVLASACAFFYLCSPQQQQQPQELATQENRSSESTRPADEAALADARVFLLDLEQNRLKDWKKIESPDVRRMLHLILGERHFGLGHYAAAAARYKSAVDISSGMSSLSPDMFGATVEQYIRACTAAGIPMERWLPECNRALLRAHECGTLRAERALLVLRADAYARQNQRAAAERDFRNAVAIADDTTDLLSDSPQESYLKYAQWCTTWNEANTSATMFRKAIDRMARREKLGLQATQSDFETLCTIAFSQPGIEDQISTLAKLLLNASHTNNPLENIERQIWASQLTAKAGHVAKARTMLDQIYNAQTGNLMRAHVLHAYMDAIPMSNKELLAKMTKALQLCKEVETPQNQISMVTALTHVSTACARNKHYREAIDYAQQASAVALREARSPGSCTSTPWTWYEVSLSNYVNAVNWAEMLGDKSTAKKIAKEARSLINELEALPDNAAHKARLEQLRASLSQG